MADNVNIIVQDTINDIVVNAAVVVETIDINVQAAVDVVDIVANPNNYVVNINRIIGEQVQSDWTQTDNQAPDYIKNKPTIPTATSDLTNDGEDGVNPFITAADVTPQVNSDWDATSGVAEILNKPTIPAAQVNSDWDATSGVAEILNKPTIPAAVTKTSDLINDGENGVDPFITAADIPPVTGFVPYTGATNDVNLGTHDLTATQGTFATSGNPDTLTVNHSSGSGKALTITKGGAGEGIYVNKTSGSGNAVTIVGDLEATNLKRTGGTSSQFLKANGSVDSNTYFQLPSLTSGSVLFSNGTTIAQDNTQLFWDDTNNRLGIGTASPQEKLQVVGGNILFGNGYNLRSITSSGGISNVFGTTASNELLFGSGNWTLIRFDVGGAAARMSIPSTGNVLINTTTDAGFKLDVNGTARVSGNFTLGGTTSIGGGYGVASGTFNIIQNGPNVVPSSGNMVVNGFVYSGTINQTGGANGITRGLYINPTLTAAADFRAIEVANGITILGASTTAKASLRIPSGTAPTTPTNGDIWFDGTDLKMRIGGVTKTFTLI